MSQKTTEELQTELEQLRAETKTLKAETAQIKKETQELRFQAAETKMEMRKAQHTTNVNRFHRNLCLTGVAVGTLGLALAVMARNR